MPVYSNNVKNKLLVMYFINTMNTPLLGYQIEDYFVNNVLIETIELHTIIQELLEQDFIATQNAFNRTYFTVTKKGKDALESLQGDLTETARALIDDYCRDNKIDIINSNNIVTACKQLDANEFELTLTLLNNTRPIIELKLNVDDEDAAVKATQNWASASNDIYSIIINKLILDD